LTWEKRRLALEMRAQRRNRVELKVVERSEERGKMHQVEERQVRDPWM
jgi:hypothetical protein